MPAAHAGGKVVLSTDASSVSWRGWTQLPSPAGHCTQFARLCDRTVVTTADAGELWITIWYDELTSWTFHVLDSAGNVVAENEGWVNPEARFPVAAGATYTIVAWRTSVFWSPGRDTFQGQLALVPS